MKELEIAIDRRCCNEKKVSINIFEKKIQQKLYSYKIDFTYSESPIDAFCEYGHTIINFVNISKEEQDSIVNNINQIFNELIEV